MNLRQTAGPDSGKPRRLLWRLARLVLAAYVGVLLFLYLFQRRLQYFPVTSSPARPPGADGLEEFNTVTADGVRIQGWYWPGEKPLTLVIFHGNGGHRGHRFEWMQMLRKRLRVGICLPDYRGYGGSEGTPTEAGLYRDAEATLAWLKKRGASALVYYGESLGSGVAVELARRQPPRALVLQSGFSSAVAVGRQAYPFVPVSLLMKDRYDSASKMDSISCPVLVIHGDRDRIIPIEFGRALYDAANEPKEWLAIRGAGHNDLPWAAGPEYLERLEAFLER